MRTTPLLSVLTGLTLFLACQSQKTYTIEEMDGHSLVHNTGPLFKTSPVSLEFIRQYGSEDPGAGGLLLGEPMGVMVDNAERVSILDRGSCEIITCSPDGEEILRFGKKGQGPGEMMYPYRPALIDGTIYVPDFAGMVHRFTPDGAYLGRIASPSPLSMLTMRDSATIIVNVLARGAMEGDGTLLHLYTKDGGLISSFCPLAPHADPGAATSFNQLHVVPDQQGNIIVAFIAQNRVEKYNAEGRLLWKMDRRTPIEEFIREAGADPDYGFMNWDVSRITRSLQVDDKNRIWIISFTGQPDPAKKDYTEEEIAAFFVFDVFDENGIHLFSLEFPPESFDTFQIIGDRMFFNDPRARGVVREYTIKNKE
ncbi:hypothetical protein JXO52_05530 [bacterium]|nr:hypothetical protein [bacterium]